MTTATSNVGTVCRLAAKSLPAPVHRIGAWQLDLRSVIDLLGGDGGCDDDGLLGERFAVQRVDRGALLIHEGAQARSLFVVQAGSFKCVKTAEDGYEHVLSFAWPGDVIGYDGLYREHYAFGAQALEDSRAVALPMAGLARLRQRSPALDASLQASIAGQLAHVGDVAEMMAAVAAEARLARFLCQLSARMAERGRSPRRLRLGMNRRDIGNHLGLAHETISRSLRALADRGCLRVDNREVEIVDPQRLKLCARNTRRLVEARGNPVGIEAGGEMGARMGSQMAAAA